MGKILCDTLKKKKKHIPTHEESARGGKKRMGKDKLNTIIVAQEVANQIKKGELVNMSAAMLKTGYSKITCKSNAKIIRERPLFKQTLECLIENVKDKRALALAGITFDKVKKASSIDNARTFDILNKNAQLLENKPTDITVGIGALLVKIEQENKDKNNL